MITDNDRLRLDQNGMGVSKVSDISYYSKGRTPGLSDRAIQILIGWLYTIVFFVIYHDYVSEVWSYVGFTYRSMSFFEYGFIFVCITAISAYLPIKYDKPSAIILWLLYVFVCVPTLVITFMIGSNAPGDYIASLLAMVFAIVICSIVSDGYDSNSEYFMGIESNFLYIFFALFVIASAILYIEFRDILSFASYDDIYIQRFIATDMTSGFAGYVQTYYSNVLASAVLSLGLCYRKRWMVVAGVGGYVFAYTINAAKSALVIPIAMIALNYLMARAFNRTAFLTAALVAISLVGVALPVAPGDLNRIHDLLAVRSMAIPGQTFSQYYDFFTPRGYTWWSNTKGINLIVDPPPSFRADPRWPNLGLLVGADYSGYDSRQNSNANLFVGEGVAAGGAIGVVVIGLVLALWLRLLDMSARGWNQRFVVLLLVPVGFSLTNGHLSTILLSCGGAFWPIVFAAYKPGRSAHQ